MEHRHMFHVKHFYNMPTVNLFQGLFEVNGNVVQTPVYNEAPNSFAFNGSGNEYAIPDPTRNPAINWPDLPPSFQGDPMFVINNSDGSLRAPWSSMPSRTTYSSDYSNYGVIMTIGNMEICAYYYSVTGVYSFAVFNKTTHQPIADSGPASYLSSYNRCFMVFIKFNNGIKDYYLPYFLGTNLNGFGSINGFDWYYHLAAYEDITPLEADDPYHFAPDNDPQGGFGDFDYSSEDDSIPSLPTISATNAGFCSLYKMTDTQVKDLADYLWGLGSLASFLPIFSNPMECILSLGIVPCDPTAANTYYIKVGNLVTTVQGALVGSQYYEVNCGSITVNGKKFANNFMNYSPYTKAELYLPYIGTVSLNIDEIMDSTITIKYHIDLLSGSCVAYVLVSKKYDGVAHTNVLYQYSGNVLTNIPITSQNFTQVLQAVIGAVASGADKAAGAGLKGGMTEGMDSAINSVESFKPHIQRSGNMSSSCGLMGEQVPKLIFSLPKLVKVSHQGQHLGFPRYQEYTLSSLKGYTTCYKVHLTGIKCTDAERDEIISLLTSGIVLPSSSPSLPTLTGDKNIGVYTYTAEKIEMDKASGLVTIDTMEGTFKEDCDVLNPVITIEAASSLTKAKILNEANYVYLKDFGRTYYITKATAKAGGLIELQMHVDVLMSWAASIRNQTVVVDRTAEVYNMMLTDGAIRTENDPYTVVMHPTGGTGFSSPHFIMAVAGSPST